jgi:hypothetical protein
MQGGKTEIQRGGHPKLLTNQENRHYVTLVTKGQFGTTFATTKQLQSETSKMLPNITMRRVLREVELGAQVQQRKSFMNRKHVLARPRFAQRY